MVVVESALLGKGGWTWGGYWSQTRTSSWRDLRVVAGHIELSGPIRYCGIGQEHSHHLKALLLKRPRLACEFWASLESDATRKLAPRRAVAPRLSDKSALIDWLFLGSTLQFSSLPTSIVYLLLNMPGKYSSSSSLKTASLVSAREPSRGT